MAISRLSAVALDHTTTGSEWELPRTRWVRITACLTDQGREQAVKGQTFEVYRSEDGVKLPIDQTDESSQSTIRGCTTWTEEFTLEAFAQPTYIKANRRLQPSSYYNPIELHAAINPWSGWNGSEAAIINLDLEPQVARFETFGNPDVPFKVETVDYRFAFDNDAGGAQGFNGKLTVSFAPRVQLTGMSGGYNPPYTIIKGLFKIRPQIWRVQDNGKAEPITADLGPSEEMPFDNKLFTSKSQTLRFGRIDRSGTFYLVLRVEPVRGPKTLLGFTKAYRMGDWNSLPKGSAVLEPDFQLPPDTFPTVIKESPVAAPSRYLFTMIGGARAGVPPEFQETQTQTAVETLLRVKVVNPLTQKGYAGREFYIYSLSNPSETVSCQGKPTCTTDFNGVLRWSDVIPFDPTKRIQSKTYQVRIVDARDPNDVFVQNVEINPAVANSDAFFRDHREGVFQRPASMRMGDPVMYIAGLCLERVTHLEAATVDQHLNLNLLNRYDIALDPVVQRLDDTSVGMDAPAMMPRLGPYLLSVVVLRPSATKLDVEDVISSSQEIVHFTGGENITGQIDLKIRDPRLSLERSITVAQMSFIDPTSPRDQHGQFIPSQVKILATEFVTPPLVFGTVLSEHTNCGGKVETFNWLNPQFKNTNAETEKADIHQLARGYQQLLSTEQQLAETLRPTIEQLGWKQMADSYGWNAVEITGPQSLVKEGYYGNTFSAEIFEEALKCLEIASWQYEQYPAKCLRDAKLLPVFKQMCGKTADVAQNLEGGRVLESFAKATSPEMAGMAFGMAVDGLKRACVEAPHKYFATAKRYHVYKHEGARVEREAGDRLSISRTLGLGVFIGTEVMFERNAGLTFYGAALATLGNPLGDQLRRPLHTALTKPKSFFDFSTYFRKDLGLGAAAVFLRPNQTAAAVAVKPMSKQAMIRSLAVAYEDDALFSPKLAVPARRIERFQWIYDYEIENNEATTINSAGFNLDIWDTKIKATRWRSCYSFAPQASAFQTFAKTESDEKILADEARYYCFPIRTETNFLRQRYRVFHYTAPTDPILNNAAVPSFTQNIVIRGERDFQLFMTVFHKRLSPYHREQLPVPVDSAVDQMRKDLPNRFLMLGYDSGVIQAEPPENRAELIEPKYRGPFINFLCNVGDFIWIEACDYTREKMPYYNIENVPAEKN